MDRANDQLDEIAIVKHVMPNRYDAGNQEPDKDDDIDSDGKYKHQVQKKDTRPQRWWHIVEQRTDASSCSAYNVHRSFTRSREGRAL